MYSSTLLVFRRLGLFSKSDLDSGVARFRIFSWQGTVCILFIHLFLLKNLVLTIFFALGGERSFWSIFYYNQMILGACVCYYAVILQRQTILDIFQKLEANSKPNEHDLISKLSSKINVLVTMTEIGRWSAIFAILTHGSEFEKYVDQFWFDLGGIIPTWLGIILVTFDLVCRTYMAFVFFVAVCNVALVFYHLVLQFENLKADIETLLFENETTVATIKDIVEFRKRFSTIADVTKILNDVISNTVAILCFLFGTFLFTFILLSLRGQALVYSETESFERIVSVVVLAYPVVACVYAVFRLDDRQLYPITTVRTLGAFSVEDDFSMQCEVLVEQLMTRPRLTVGNFFQVGRVGLWKVFGAIGTYFMALLDIDAEVKDEILAFLQSED